MIRYLLADCLCFASLAAAPIKFFHCSLYFLSYSFTCCLVRLPKFIDNEYSSHKKTSIADTDHSVPSCMFSLLVCITFGKMWTSLLSYLSRLHEYYELVWILWKRFSMSSIMFSTHLSDLFSLFLFEILNFTFNLPFSRPHEFLIDV